MRVFRMDNIDVEEGPHTIGYVLTCLLSAAFEFDLEIEERLSGDFLNVVHDGDVLFSIKATGAFLELFISILSQISPDLEDGGEEGWNYLS